MIHTTRIIIIIIIMIIIIMMMMMMMKGINLKTIRLQRIHDLHVTSAVNIAHV